VTITLSQQNRLLDVRFGVMGPSSETRIMKGDCIRTCLKLNLNVSESTLHMVYKFVKKYINITITILDIIHRPVFYLDITFRRLESVSVLT
jgi:hypothetical protein